MTVKDKLELMQSMERTNEARIKRHRANGMLLGVKVDTASGRMYQTECPNTLDGIRSVLKCDWIETDIRRIGERYFMIICDEQGHLKRHPVASGVYLYAGGAKADFVGNLFIISDRIEGDGDMVGLTTDEVTYVLNNGIIRFAGGREVLRCDY